MFGRKISNQGPPNYLGTIWTYSLRKLWKNEIFLHFSPCFPPVPPYTLERPPKYKLLFWKVHETTNHS